jgi:hypothetical protein
MLTTRGVRVLGSIFALVRQRRPKYVRPQRVVSSNGSFYSRRKRGGEVTLWLTMLLLRFGTVKHRYEGCFVYHRYIRRCDL